MRIWCIICAPASLLSESCRLLRRWRWLRGTSCTSCRCRRGRARSARPWVFLAAALAVPAGGRGPFGVGLRPLASTLPRTWQTPVLEHDAALLVLELGQPALALLLRRRRLPAGSSRTRNSLFATFRHDAVHHRPEHVVALFLVLQLRVLLPVAAQADALAQLVHRLQVIDPLAVDLLEVEVPREVQERQRPELGLARLGHRSRPAPRSSRRCASRSSERACRASTSRLKCSLTASASASRSHSSACAVRRAELVDQRADQLVGQIEHALALLDQRRGRRLARPCRSTALPIARSLA